MGYNGGADSFSNLALYSNYETILHSAFKEVSTKVEKATYSRLEVLTARPASSGHIRVSYRVNLTASFTTLDTFTADSSTLLFSNEGIGLIDIENIQVRVEMDGNFDLINVRLLP